MVTIFVKIQPFTFEQTICVAKDNEIIDSRVVNDVNAVKAVVKDFCMRYHAQGIKLAGSQDYLSKMVAEMQNQFGINCPVEIIKGE